MADEVNMESDGTIMEFNYLTVTDPQNFMNVLDRFNEPISPSSKLGFMKILNKYKVIGNFGNINDWLRDTFSNIVTK